MARIEIEEIKTSSDDEDDAEFRVRGTCDGDMFCGLFRFGGLCDGYGHEAGRDIGADLPLWEEIKREIKRRPEYRQVFPRVRPRFEDPAF